MKKLTAETPLARRFAAALLELQSGRTRISIDEYAAAFLVAEPLLTTSPDRRGRLAAAIQELVEAGAIHISRSVDRSELPSLPRFITLVQGNEDRAAGREVSAFPWRPELAWAARLPLRRSEFEALRAIQTFLRDQATEATVIPLGERSLELFDDEKRLDVLVRNRRLFAPGRLSLEMLRCRLYAPPFVYRHVGPGPVALVVENVATYHSVLECVTASSPVGLVIFGAGGNFGASVSYLGELIAEGPAARIREIRYFGDLDRRGLEIPIAANATALEANLPAVRPAVGLWAKLLAVGRRAPHAAVDIATAERLTAWLPVTLRSRARDVLVSGARLAQEAVGTRLLKSDSTWTTWAQLGPPGVERAGESSPELHRTSVSQRGRLAPTGRDAVVLDDGGNECQPASQSEWEHWVAAGQTRNWLRGDPLLDWLRRYGDAAGFVRDDRRPDYDLRTDFRRFVLEKGVLFEDRVLELVAQRVQVSRVAATRDDAQSLRKAFETVEVLRSGAPVVTQAVLRNPQRRTYGVADLLVRSDVLAAWFPELISAEEAGMPAPGLGHASFHYRVVDLKFHTFDLTADGHVTGSGDQLAYAVQAWLYADALGRVQGYTPSAAYLLGRSWEQGEHRGQGCFERLARVDIDRWLPNRDATIEQLARESVEWIRRLRADGATWHVLPVPSVPELYPHARNADDAPWHAAKREIAHALRELTLLPAMNPQRRAVAHAQGIRTWDDPKASAAAFGVDSPTFASRLDAVLAANRSAEAVVLPERFTRDEAWRIRAGLEFFVDFETVSNLDDDFSTLPDVGGQALIAQIGCGHFTRDGEWKCVQWTVDALTPDEELRIIAAWFAHVEATCVAGSVAPQEARLFHWSVAEPVNLETAYNAARTRHPNAGWPAALPWFDLLERVFRAEPVAVTGAFNFGLKSIAKAMHAAGLISVTWPDGMEGLSAMVGIWTAARESALASVRLSNHPLMLAVGRYNEIDCRVMGEILAWLRDNR